jgi:hypothetical protein
VNVGRCLHNQLGLVRAKENSYDRPHVADEKYVSLTKPESQLLFDVHETLFQAHGFKNVDLNT